MKYLGYAALLAAGAAGYFQAPPFIILLLALLSTILHASARRKTLKETPMAPDQSMIADGAFLLFGQLLLMFTLYILGYFFGAATPSGMAQRTIVGLIGIGIVGAILGLYLRGRDRANKD